MIWSNAYPVTAAVLIRVRSVPSDTGSPFYRIPASHETECLQAMRPTFDANGSAWL